MKKILLTAAVMAAMSSASAYELKNEAERVGYTIGAEMGATVQGFMGDDASESIDFNALIVGLRDAYEQNELSLSPEEMETAMNNFAEKRIEEMQNHQEKLKTENLKAGEEFLAANAKKEGVVTTDSGLQYLVVEEGEGRKPSVDSEVKVDYEGRLIDGTVFDSSIERGEPVTFYVGEVISGWAEALQLMPVGSKYRLFIPAELAYGEADLGDIPPNSTLIFDVTLLEIVDEVGNSDFAQQAQATIEEAKANADMASNHAKEIVKETKAVPTPESTVTVEEQRAMEQVGEEAQQIKLDASKQGDATPKQPELDKMGDNATQ